MTDNQQLTTDSRLALRTHGVASNKFLHPMIHRVGHVEIPFRVERDAPRIAELPGCRAGPAQNLHRLPMRVKNLDAAVAKLAHELKALSIHFHVVRITHLASARSRLAVCRQKLSVRRKYLNAMMARVGDVEPVPRIDAQPLRAVELAIAIAAASQDANPIRPFRSE